MTESELTKIKEVLQTEYILLKKGALWSFLGGVFAFLIAAGFISYQAGLQAIKSSSAQRITNELEQLKINAKKSFFEIEKMRNELNSKNQAEINHLVDNVKKTTIEIEEMRNDLKSKNLKVSFGHQKSWSVGPNKDAVKSFTVDATGVLVLTNGGHGFGSATGALQGPTGRVYYDADTPHHNRGISHMLLAREGDVFNAWGTPGNIKVSFYPLKIAW